MTTGSPSEMQYSSSFNTGLPKQSTTENPNDFDRGLLNSHTARKDSSLCQIRTQQIEKHRMALLVVTEDRDHMVLVMMVREPDLSFESII